MEDDTPLGFDSPESRTITAASYDPENAILTVHFKTGKTYSYSNFPPDLWREWVQAESKGSFFAAHVRPMFSGVIHA